MTRPRQQPTTQQIFLWMPPLGGDREHWGSIPNVQVPMINREPTTAAGKAALAEWLRQDNQQHRIVNDWDDIAKAATDAHEQALQVNGYSVLNEESTAERARLEQIEELTRQFLELEVSQSMEANSAFNELCDLLGVNRSE
jgi:hypothetical protein